MSSDPGGKKSWSRRALVLLALLAIGLVPAGPFLTRRAVGTSEAYNYSLSLADALSQMRAGVVPPLVGQTPFAFNGRIHPLRNAPYLTYLAGMIDAASAHRLGFWELQNLSLALSLMGAAFACYFGLRWGTGCRREWALALSAAYAWCPALLAAADAQDLYMTVAAAPFLPLALAACLRQGWRPAVRHDLLLAGALAAAWLAHPPVALWATAAVGLVRLAIFLRRPSGRAAAGLAAAAGLFLALAGFGFVSAQTATRGLALRGGGGAFQADYARVVLENLRAAVPAALLPVARPASDLGNLQLGYSLWLLLALALAGLGWSRTARWDLRRVSVLALVGSTLGLLALCLPIPGLTHALWLRLPSAVHLLTNIWPMQRLYLVAAALIVFAAALTPAGAIPRRAAWLLVAAGLAWTLAQARPFLANAFALRRSEADTAASLADSNLDLSVTSYAFFGLPADYTSGVIDPLLQLRLVSLQDRTVTADLSRPALARAPVVRQGVFRRISPQSDVLTPGLTLQPGRRYLLQLDFLTGPTRVYLKFSGEGMRRSYRLPDAGGEAGFGMAPQNSHSLSLWTALDHPEEVSLEIPAWGHDPEAREHPVDFARFTLREVDPASLAVRLESFLPLRCTVEAPREGLYLETFRQFLPGYTARVGDRAAPVLPSPAGNVMVPVPEGRSEVEVSYAGSPLLLVSFWVSVGCWLGFVLWLAGGLWPALGRGEAWLARRWRPLAIAAGSALAAAAAWRELRPAPAPVTVGPVRVRFLLPLDRPGTNPPLVVLGHTRTGAIVFLNLTDAHHVRVGTDVWGTLAESEPIAVDYNRIQELVVSASALYPRDDPGIRALDQETMRQLGDELRVDLNGHPVLAVSHPPDPGETSDVHLGENPIGGSFAGPRFSGEILSSDRLPLPRMLELAPGQAVRVQAALPVGRGRGREPLLTLAGDGKMTSVYAVRVSPQSLRVGMFSPAGRWLESKDIPAGGEGALDLVVRAGRTEGMDSSPAIAIEQHGVRLLGPAVPHPLLDSLRIFAGRNLAEAAPVNADFAGAALRAEILAVPAAADFGACDLVVSFPLNRPGRAEPLVVSGQPGAGDLIYVVYVDARHVRLGLDHWGRGGVLSEPVPIDYGVNHELEISLGSLYPPENDARWGKIPVAEQRGPRSRVSVRVDGREVLAASLAAYPATPGQITVGENRIGGSTCDAQFTGRIHFAGRRPIAAP